MKSLYSRICAVMLLAVGLQPGLLLAQSAASPSQRLDYDIKYLASDELEGREPGSRGIELAADYIIDTWKEFGVESGTEDGTYRQHFDLNLGTVVERDNTSLVLHGPNDQKIELEFGADFQSLMTGGSGDFEGAELVFVGYGITDEDNNYLEYRDIDVDGKVVVLIRMEPQQRDPNSVFDGTENSRNASISRKLELARDAGARGLILINDGLRVGEDSDELEQSDTFGRVSNGLPFFHVKREIINDLLKQAPLVAPPGGELDNLDDIETRLDDYLEPLSQPIEEWTVSGTAAFSDNDVDTSNIVGIVRGEGPNADEVIVIGGHYDHLGFGGYGSAAPGRREIHNGADDNATGTAGIVELARRFAQADEKPARTLVFIAFSGEERGLLGSAYYVEDPLFPLDKTIAMINYDMIGQLRNDKLTIFGTGTGDTFDAILDRSNDSSQPLVLDKISSPFAGSDHMAFVRKDIPVMFLHTGTEGGLYHTPEDDYETLNMQGANRVVDFTERLISEMASAEAAPKFTEVVRARRRQRPAFFGVRLDYVADDRGPRIEEIVDDAPADKAGLQVGDVIVSMGGETIADQGEMTEFLRVNRPGSDIEVAYIRGDDETTVTGELARTPRTRRYSGGSDDSKKGDDG
ncbi:MAG: M20/M25/M40 family metallo-hydrolase [Pirellulaceae bacterium]